MAKNTKYAELRDKIGAYLTETWDELRADIEKMAPKDRAAAKLKLMDYHIPKVQASRDDNTGTKNKASDLLAEES